MSELKLAVNTSVDRHSDIATFQTRGRAQARAFLTDSAARNLISVIEAQETWNAVFDRAGQNVDLNANALSALSVEQMRGLLGHVNQTASSGFQYFFANIPLYDIYHSGRKVDPALRKLYEFINGEAFLAACRALTGFSNISFADAQITRYGPGQFLTRHDDNVEGKNRLAAYVLNLTETWRSEWGGALEFYDAEGNIEQGFTPAFNTLNLFAVPQTHAVTYVTPFAQAYRYAITGWLRGGEDPKGS